MDDRRTSGSLIALDPPRDLKALALLNLAYLPGHNLDVLPYGYMTLRYTRSTFTNLPRVAIV